MKLTLVIPKRGNDELFTTLKSIKRWQLKSRMLPGKYSNFRKFRKFKKIKEKY